MPNLSDLLGALVQSASSSTSQTRMGNALEDLSRSGFGGQGNTGEVMGGGLLGGIMEAVQGGLSSAARNPAQVVQYIHQSMGVAV